MLSALAACSSPEQKASLEAFDGEKARVESQIAALTEEAQTAEQLAQSEQKVLDESTRTALVEGVTDARGVANGIEIPKAKSKVEDIDEQTSALKLIDLSADLDKLKSLEKALDDKVLAGVKLWYERLGLAARP